LTATVMPSRGRSLQLLSWLTEPLVLYSCTHFKREVSLVYLSKANATQDDRVSSPPILTPLSPMTRFGRLSPGRVDTTIRACFAESCSSAAAPNLTSECSLLSEIASIATDPCRLQAPEPTPQPDPYLLQRAKKSSLAFPVASALGRAG